MQKKDEIGKVMIYILLAVIIVVGCKRVIDSVQRVSVSYHQIQTETLDTLPVFQNDDCWIEKTGEKCRISDGMNDVFKYGLNKLFVAMLLLLASVNFGKGVLLQQGDYDPKERIYHIIYMQNKDGCKQSVHNRINSCHL